MKLKEFVEKHCNGNASEFARMVGVTRQCANYWINGLRTPTVRLALKIERATKGMVKVKDWA